MAREDGFELEAIWDTLSTSLNEIHSKNASRLSYEELYRQAYTLVLRKKGEVLYNRVEQLERDWLKKVVSTQIIESLSPALLAPDNTVSGLVARKDAGERLVRALTAAWEDHVLCLSMITSVLMYMVWTFADYRRREDLADTSEHRTESTARMPDDRKSTSQLCAFSEM